MKAGPSKWITKRAELTKLQREIEATRRRIHLLHNELHGIPMPHYGIPCEPVGPRVSDHALVRYLERVHSLNLEPLRKKLLTPDAVRSIEAGTQYIAMGNFTLVVSGKTIATVLTQTMMEKTV